MVRLCIRPPPEPPPIENHNWGRGNLNLCINASFHKDIIFSSPIRVRRMGEGREGGQIVPADMGDPVGIITKRNDTVYLVHGDHPASFKYTIRSMSPGE